MSIEETDRESAAVAKNQAGRISLDQIKASIAYVGYQQANMFPVYPPDGGAHASSEEQAAISASMYAMTLCIVCMRNGFLVIGKSAPADPENFNVGLGRKYAYEDAIRQLWPLMAFALKDRQAAKSGA